MASPSMPGTAYVLFHHVMGECNGSGGVWGTSGAGWPDQQCDRLGSSREAGRGDQDQSRVARILVKNGTVQECIADGWRTGRPGWRQGGPTSPPTQARWIGPTSRRVPFVQAVPANIIYASASCKINIALAELPDFTAVPGTAPGPQHRGTIHISPTMEYIERAYDQAKYGHPSEHPIIEATIPSVLDDTVAPTGKYVMSMFTQYFPYKLADGLSLEAEKEKYADRCFDLMNQYAPNFKRSVIARQVLSPVDLEQRFGLTGGNIMQGVMSLSSLSFMRPVPGCMTTARRCAECTSAARRRTRAAASWARAATTRRGASRASEEVGGEAIGSRPVPSRRAASLRSASARWLLLGVRPGQAGCSATGGCDAPAR